MAGYLYGAVRPCTCSRLLNETRFHIDTLASNSASLNRTRVAGLRGASTRMVRRRAGALYFPALSLWLLALLLATAAERVSVSETGFATRVFSQDEDDDPNSNPNPNPNPEPDELDEPEPEGSRVLELPADESLRDAHGQHELILLQ